MTVDFDELEPGDAAPTPDSESSLRALVARLTRERNHYQDDATRLSGRVLELEKQLIAARAVGRVM